MDDEWYLVFELHAKMAPILIESTEKLDLRKFSIFATNGPIALNQGSKDADAASRFNHASTFSKRTLQINFSDFNNKKYRNLYTNFNGNNFPKEI